MSPWKNTSIPTQKVYVCFSENSRMHVHHIYYSSKKAEAWKTAVEELRERILKSKDFVMAEDLREKLLKEYNLSYYDIPIVQEVALE
jgi:hypothetical protein